MRPLDILEVGKIRFVDTHVVSGNHALVFDDVLLRTSHVNKFKQIMLIKYALIPVVAKEAGKSQGNGDKRCQI